jgi:hypothetical protein
MRRLSSGSESERSKVKVIGELVIVVIVKIFVGGVDGYNRGRRQTIPSRDSIHPRSAKWQMPRQPTYFLPPYPKSNSALNSPGRTKYLMLGPRMASVSTVTVDLFFGVILTVFRWVFICGSTAVGRFVEVVFQVEVFEGSM